MHSSNTPSIPPENDPEDGNAALSPFSQFVVNRRAELRQRFRGSNHWLRIMCLAIVLIDFVVIAIASTMSDLALMLYEPGTASVLGGTTLAVIIGRIEKYLLSWDWILLGATTAMIGLIVASDSALASMTSFVMFTLLMASSSLLLLWIATTIEAERGGLWIMSGGITNLLCTLVSVIDRQTTFALRPDTVAASSLLLIGMSLLGLAVSLRKTVKEK